MAVRREQEAAPPKNSRPASDDGAADGGEHDSHSTHDHRRAAQQAAGRVADDTLDTGRRAAEAIGDTTDKLGEEVASATKRVGDHVTEASRRSVETASAAIEQGADVISKNQRRVAETMRNQTSQVANSVTEAGDVYRETAESTSEDLRHLMSASGVVASGIQDMQRKMLEIMQDNFQRAIRAPQEALRCNSIPQLAELHRSWLLTSMDRLLNGSVEFLRISERIAQDASLPLQARLQDHGQASAAARPSRPSRPESRSDEMGPPDKRGHDRSQPDRHA